MSTTNKRRSIARGTYLKGPKHSEGGIPVYNKSAPYSSVEVEGGEVVITAPAVEDPTPRRFNGKMMTNREILSQINQSGGGIALEKGGAIPAKIHCTGRTYEYGGEMLSDYDIVKQCGCMHNMATGGTVISLTSLLREFLKNRKRLFQLWQNIPNQGWQRSFGFQASDQGDANKLAGYWADRVNIDKTKFKATVATKYELEKQGVIIQNQWMFDALRNKHNSTTAQNPQLLDEFQKITASGGFLFQLYRGREEELIVLIQDQATGMDANRTTVDPTGQAYEATVKMLNGNKDLVLRAVAALPEQKKEMILKAWKGYSIPPELRNAVKTRVMATGGQLDTIRDQLALGGSLDRRARDYMLLDSAVSFDRQKLERGGAIPVPYTTMPSISMLTESEPASPVPMLDEKHLRKISISLKNIDNIPNRTISSSKDIYELLVQLWDKESMNVLEMAYALFLNQANAVIGYIDLSKGGVTGTVVDPSIVAAMATSSLAKSVVIAHNHPSGELKPSRADVNVTNKLSEGLKLLDIRLLDHLILSPQGTYYSFADEGELTHARGGRLTKKTHFGYANAYELNRAIEKLLDDQPDNSSFTMDQKEFIRYYSGYGGLEKFGATGKGLLYEYFTPPGIAEPMWGLAYKYGYTGGYVCEPSAGIGEFVKYAPDQRVDAYEINPYSARILKILYPNTTVHTTYFEELFIKNRNTIKNKVAGLKKYQLVIGNPPYGDFGGKFAGMGERDYTHAANYIDYFIFRGLDLLYPGGLLIMVVGAEVASGGRPFLQQQMNACKKEIAEKSKLLDAYRLPNGVFERTDVLTDIIVLQKK